MPYEKTWEKEFAKLQTRENEALQGGGEKRLQKQRDMGKMTARERIDYIMDPGSFVELNMLAEHQCQDFGMDEKKFLGDGVVTGHGTINERFLSIQKMPRFLVVPLAKPMAPRSITSLNSPGNIWFR